LVVSDEAVRLAVIDKLGWVKRQRAQFAKQPRQSEREMVNGESHYFMGQRYRLRVQEVNAPARVAIRGLASLDLFRAPRYFCGAAANGAVTVVPGATQTLMPELLATWQRKLKVQPRAWGVKKMKTKWRLQPCERAYLDQPGAGKRPAQCLEYIVVHELMHLLERRHSERFTALMDQHLPDWRARKTVLNAGILGTKSGTIEAKERSVWWLNVYQHQACAQWL